MTNRRAACSCGQLHLTTEGDPNSEPASVMAAAALMLCHRDPQSLTGRVTYSQELLAELGVPVPQAS